MPVMTAPTTEELWTLCRYHRMKDIAAKYRLTTQEMVARFKQAGLMGGARCPSPDEIEREKQLLQSRWNEQTRMERWVGRRGRRLV